MQCSIFSYMLDFSLTYFCQDSNVRIAITYIKGDLIMADTVTLYVLTWTEYERGCGQRPDGISIHSSLDKAAEFVREDFADAPAFAPDEYSQPDGPVGNGIHYKTLTVPNDHAFAEAVREAEGRGRTGYRCFRTWNVEGEVAGTFDWTTQGVAPAPTAPQAPRP
jgi:hypothetical protein